MEMNKFINPIDISDDLISKISKTHSANNAFNLSVINEVLLPHEIEYFLYFIEKSPRIPVGIDGIKNNYKNGDKIGSYRMSIFNEELAEIIWKRVDKHFNPLSFEEKTTDAPSMSTWVPVGINPLFRVIEYKENGMLIPHYDAPYIYDENKMTLKSFILYLSTNKEGSTNFLFDEQMDIDFIKRDFSDRPLCNNSIISSINPIKGSALAFDHRTLHSVDQINKERKIIVRTDIVYKRVK